MVKIICIRHEEVTHYISMEMVEYIEIEQVFNKKKECIGYKWSIKSKSLSARLWVFNVRAFLPLSFLKEDNFFELKNDEKIQTDTTEAIFDEMDSFK